MRITARSVVEAVAERHGRTFADMCAVRRTRVFAWPRQEAMYEVYIRCPHMSMPAIGRMLHRDHTTVLHGIRAHCQRLGIRYTDVRRQPVYQSGDIPRSFVPMTAAQYREVIRVI